MKTLSPRLTMTLAVGVALSLPGTAAEAHTDSALEGGWVIAEWEAPDSHTGPTPQRGLFVFTESGHYSMMFVHGEPRAHLSENPSDGEIAAAWRPIIANSGRYAISGNEITYEAFVALSPQYMSEFGPSGGEGNAATMTFNIADGLLTLSFEEGDSPMSGATATLRRPGGA